MLKPRVSLCSVPVLYAFGDVDDVAGLKRYGWFAPFLIPSLAADADEDLVGTVMYVPVVSATRLKGHVTIALYCLFISRKVFGSNGCKMAVALEILGVSGVGIALGPVAEPEVCFVEIDNLVPWDIVALAPVV